MNESGQGEAVFRLVIDSVIGLAILLIIVAAVGYFNDRAIEQSKYDLAQLIENASNSPDGQVLSSKGDLLFAKGFAVDTADVELWTGVSAKCFSFSTGMSSIKILSDGAKAEFTQGLAIKSFAQCKPSGAVCNPRDPSAECCFTCLIFFGKTMPS